MYVSQRVRGVRLDGKSVDHVFEETRGLLTVDVPQGSGGLEHAVEIDL